MAMDETEDRLTDAEVAEFARKMGQWGEDLTPKERAFLMDIVARAASTASDDVKAYVLNALTEMEGAWAVRMKGRGVYTPDSFTFGINQLLPLIR